MGSGGFKPSQTRRRLSATMANGAQVKVPIVSRDNGDCPPQRTSSRRTSVLTDLMARPSTSSSFAEQSIKPTIIIAMLYLNDPQPDMDKLRNVIGERLLQIPRFSSVFRMKDGKVYCDSIPNSDVDLKHHIQEVDGHGEFGPLDVSEMISAATQEWWDASLPLWKLTLVTNTGDGRSLLFCKIDHSIGDGVAMLHVLESLLDDHPDGELNFPIRRPTPPEICWSTKLVWFLYGIYDGTIGWMIKPTDRDNNLKIPSHKKIGDAGSKTFTVTRTVSLAKVKKMASMVPGASVNDLVMASVNIGIRRYLERTRDPILKDIDEHGVNLQAMSLVNLRGVADEKENGVQNLGNDFTTVNFPLPLKYNDEIDAVWRIKDMMDYYKASPTMYLMKAFGRKLLAILPEPVLIQATMETIRKPSCIISNVRAPSFECKLAGYAVDDISFLASSVIGLYVGIISYNGKVNISFATDKLARIDCDLFKKCLESAMSDLEGALLSSKTREIKQPDTTSFAAKLVEYALPVVVCVLAGGLMNLFHSA